MNEPHVDVRSGASADECRRSGIAIVGMSCLLPGARDIGQFWANVVNKVSCVREIPPGRWDWRKYYVEQQDTPDRVNSRWGGFLDPIPFNPAEYGIPPSSLPSVDPLQLLVLHAAQAALQDAGCDRDNTPKQRAAVVLGIGGGVGERGHEFIARSMLTGRFEGSEARDIACKLPEWTEDTFAGILLSMTAGRLANRLDLNGANFTVDAACASSLAAVYLACRQLEWGDADIVVTGGADICQSPFYYLCFDKTHALSSSGQCRAFDKSADGTVLGEGVVVLVLKRLADAEQNGDRVYAVIRGAAGSSDGRGKGLTAPNFRGQAAALERAYARAGVSPASVGLIEAHGTGTVAGDRTEIRALGRILRSANAKPGSVAIGSVKSMTGHTKSAAGAAGVMRAALALHHKLLPSTLGIGQPADGLAGTAIYVNSETRPWIRPRANEPRRAGVSAFGFGGTNYHAVLEEYEPVGPAAASSRWPAELFLWRGDSPREILEQSGELLKELKSGAAPTSRDLAFTLWKRAQRKTDGTTLAIVASSLDDLTAKLESARKSLAADPTGAIRDSADIHVTSTPLGQAGSVAFLFPGQGSQYPDMLRELAVHFREVREAFETADRTLDGRFDRPLSSFVFPPPRFTDAEESAARKAVTATNVAQPALGATAVGLLNLLRSLNVTPAMTAGHSYGEYAALCAAGCLTPERLFDLSEARGRFMVEEARGDSGTMAAVAADERTTRGLVGRLPGIWIANVNSPRQTIVSGATEAVAGALRLLEERGIAAQSIPVACAFHSPLVAPARERLARFLESVPFESPGLKTYSNTSGTEYPAEPEAIRAQLGNHLVSPVRFVAEIEAMYAAGARVFVEAGPRNVLSGLVDQILDGREKVVVPIETRKVSGLQSLLSALARLAAHGVPVNLDRLFEGRDAKELTLERLRAETAAAAQGAAVWLVDGAGAAPAHADRSPPASTGPSAGRDSAADMSGPSRPVPQIDRMSEPTAIRMPAAQTGPGPSDVSAVLRAHEEFMRRALDTHRRVMLAAMGGTRTPRAGEPGRSDLLPLAPAVPSHGQASEDTGADSRPPASGPAEGGAASVVEPNHDIREEVLRIVGDRTGYPPEMLELDTDMEAGLGIDSIKRVEIAGRLRKAFPHIGATPDKSRVGNLANVRTLRGLIDRIAAADPASSPPAVPPPASEESPKTVQQGSESDEPVPRLTMKLEDAACSSPELPSMKGEVIVITDDGNGIADELARLLASAGSRPVIVSSAEAAAGAMRRSAVNMASPHSVGLAVAAVREKEGPLGGVVHLHALRHVSPISGMTLDEWRMALQTDVKSLFYFTQAAAADLRSSQSGCRLLAAVPAVAGLAGGGGIAGLVNAIATEWPGIGGRTVAVDLSKSAADTAAALAREMACNTRERFISLNGDRKRIRIEPAELNMSGPKQMRIKPDWVILLTGGACGITAQVAMEIAERFKSTIVLLGRSPEPEADEPPETRGVERPEALRRIMSAELSRLRGSASIAEVESAYRGLLRSREIRATISSLRAAGSRAVYMQADVRNELSVSAVIERVYAEFGRLDGVVFGAGIVEDKRIEDKTPESFDRVFDTKADGTFILTGRLRLDSLKFAAFFSSTAYLGNAGQSDYAAANGTMNALARDLDGRMRGRSVALLWGPWGMSGMTTQETRGRFREMGVQIIPPAAGRRRFVEELEYGLKGDVEVIIGSAPYFADESAS